MKTFADADSNSSGPGSDNLACKSMIASSHCDGIVSKWAETGAGQVMVVGACVHHNCKNVMKSYEVRPLTRSYDPRFFVPPRSVPPAALP